MCHLSVNPLKTCYCANKVLVCSCEVVLLIATNCVYNILTKLNKNRVVLTLINNKMSLGKSPISILQEITQMKNLSLPVYDVHPEVTGYRCNGIVGNISASAIAASKKQAKHLCAEQMLKMLQTTQEFTIVFERITHSSVFEDPLQQLQQTTKQLNEPNFNAIGKLNELCSKNCRHIPTYSELGIVNQKFVIECKLLSYTTQGQAPTKKRAKQIAAQEMLSRIKPVDLITASNTKDEEIKIKSSRHTEMDEKVIKLFQHFSVKHKPVNDNLRSTTEADFTTENETLHKIGHTRLLPHDSISERELREMLNKMGFLYEISEIQNEPLILMLRTNPLRNHPPYTFFFSGATYNTTLIGLLKKSVQHINIMLN
ncbi:hypothetical protein ILUMI_03391 [Ignelater luminosus]|uniref:DRBM domain-containing protein n=1 Tax=Ignelater luminosus TaxID=2038154 RepID=A0A8K0DGM6_IGNLU|nr:hypothetical protein ILUMI_03391 [Ignelater luminosus]